MSPRPAVALSETAHAHPLLHIVENSRIIVKPIYHRGITAGPPEARPAWLPLYLLLYRPPSRRVLTSPVPQYKFSCYAVIR